MKKRFLRRSGIRKFCCRNLHHRVKNNLQVITSLLNLQSAKTTQPELSEFLQETQNRVRSIALIHELLYQTPDLAQLDLGKYVSVLCGHVYRTYAIDVNIVALHTNVRVDSLDLNRAIPVGLIINEVVSNSLKYAFPHGRRGSVTIDIAHFDDRHFILDIKDDGVGLPQEVDIDSTNSLGLRLVADLTKQLKGRLRIDRVDGTNITIQFPR